jgi:aspartyl-tRNA(Asn)/glutamyl-tRNA(Gln) amidotransferase subunit A
MAKSADNAVKKGEKLGLLHGIPLAIKDLTETKGIRTTFGSLLYENNIPTEDDILVRRLKDAGCVILGKTNTPEFGAFCVTFNKIFGETKNPWNLEKTPGGSSGGSAAAVASGLTPFAQGSDAGGSIRIPSCFCGVYGFKPTYGRVPHNTMKFFGNFGTFVHKGPIVRYVKDAALMLDAIVGEDATDRYSLPKPSISFFKELEKIPKKIKIGYTLDLGGTKAIDPEIENSLLNSVQKFENVNWLIERTRIRVKNFEKIDIIFDTTGSAYIFKPYLENSAHLFDPILVEEIKKGLTYTLQDYKIAEVQRELIYENICRQFKKYDILVIPTLPCTAFDLGKLSPEEINGISVTPREWYANYTYPFNLTGMPAASIPCGWSSEGLPIGMQIVGKKYDDLLVLQVSKIFEEIAPWQDKKPQFN